jgi:hypothetical protein
MELPTLLMIELCVLLDTRPQLPEDFARPGLILSGAREQPPLADLPEPLLELP